MRWIQIDGKLVPAAEAEEILALKREPKSAAVHIFHEGVYEHIDKEPIYVHSKKQLREETRSRGLTSDYAE